MLVSARNVFIGISISLTTVFAFYYFAWSFAPGSYPRAEIYEFDIPENELIEIIEEFKEENPHLKVPKLGQYELVDGRKEPSDHWYDIYFYDKDNNQIIHTWTRPASKTTTSFAYDAVNHGLTLGNWETVNDSFWWWKNTPLKTRFETTILKSIKEKTNHNIH
ncbi:MAG: hypothetical protein K9J17_17585 [Flavobacteriales bacterium]|nr:hypothetical protein [Flavobacteriales bacterium]